MDISAIAALLKAHIGACETGIVLGSGLSAFADSLSNRIEVPYKDLPGMPVSTVPGHKSAFVAGTTKEGVRVLCMQGRFHYYEGYTPLESCAGVRVMAALGIKQILLTCAVGGVNPNYAVGDLVLIKDHINFSGLSPLRGLHEEKSRFVSMNNAYSPRLRSKAQAAAAKMQIPVCEGVYFYFPGPSFETPAEIRAAKALGADIVGMSTVMEAVMAAYDGVEVLGLASVTNMAAGLAEADLNHEEVIQAGKEGAFRFARLVTAILAEI